MKTEPAWKIRKCSIVSKDTVTHVMMLSKEDIDKVYDLDMRIAEYPLR